MRYELLRSVLVTTVLTIMFIVVIALGPSATKVVAQTAELPRHTEAISWYSGSHDGWGNVGGEDHEPARLAVRKILSVPGAPWMQLVFHQGRLGKKSRIEMTSMFDGSTQVLDVETLKDWNSQSAYFNGDQVEIRLYVGEWERDVSIRVSEIVVGDRSAHSRSICGADDRIASNEPRVGRIDPIGCTAWNINNGKYLTAGHCLNGTGNMVLSYNVPLSLPDGTVQFPGPEDQYSIDQSSFVFAAGGVGNDWGVLAAFDNTQTGLQPIEVQGAFIVRQDLSPADIRITGFGSDTGVTDQTNQTNVGPNAGSTGTTMRYVTDTTGGSSGSPVIDEATDEAVGIHTHGGCASGNNSGTSFFNTALWGAILPLDSIFDDGFETGDVSGWSLVVQ
jgi:V8-like Glu-specific endopeptidase